MQHKHRYQLSPSLAPKRALATLGGVSLLALSTLSAHADPTLSELAAELRELKASNAQMRAENRQMKAAITEMRGTRVRTRETSRTYAERPAPVTAASATPASIPVMITADKKLQFGAITITPGGFIAAESVFRSRTTQSDINTDYRATPFGNSALAHLNEQRFTARQSRAALLVEGAVTPTFLASAYGEFDFLSAPVTGNANEANGFSPRVRQLYAQIDANDYGVHVVAGQIFSLATMNSKGITPRNEVTPPSIDGQYIPGFVWARQPGIRLTKDFNQKLWFSLAAEESATLFQTSCPAGQNAAGTFGLAGTSLNGTTINTVTCSAAGTGGGFASSGNLVGAAGAADDLSLNHVPDVIGKVAYEAKLGPRDVHFEALGLYRDFYDRVASTNANTGFSTNNNHDATGFGFGGGVVAAVLPRKLDFQASGLFGRGIGRYGTGQLSDVVVAQDGSLKAIPEGMLLGGFTAHITPSIDIYTFAGIERELRTYSQNPNGTYSGLGAGNAGAGVGGAAGTVPGGAAASVAGCNAEANTLVGTPLAGSVCNSTANGNNKQLFQLTAGFWDKIYKGSFGEVRVGAQYQFNERQVFNNPYLVNFATGAANATNNYQPKAFDHVVLTSLRYYPFQ